MTVRKYQSPDQQCYPRHERSLYLEDCSQVKEHSRQLGELLFFCNVAVFCVLTIIFSFVFLSLKLNTVMTFSSAILLSFLTIRVYRIIRKNRRRRS